MKLDFLPFACQDFLCVHAKRDFPDFTCTNFSSRACEKRIFGFDMHACSERTAENLYFTSYTVLVNRCTMAKSNLDTQNKGNRKQIGERVKVRLVLFRMLVYYITI